MIALLLLLVAGLQEANGACDSCCPQTCHTLECLLPANASVALGNFKGSFGVTLDDLACGEFGLGPPTSQLQGNNTVLRLSFKAVATRCTGLLHVPLLGTMPALIVIGGPASSFSLALQLEFGSLPNPLGLPRKVNVLDVESALVVLRVDVVVNLPGWVVTTITQMVNTDVEQTAEAELVKVLNALVADLNGLALLPPPPLRPAPNAITDTLIALDKSWWEILQQSTHRASSVIANALALLNDTNVVFNSSLAVPLRYLSVVLCAVSTIDETFVLCAVDD
jgi:hypothetical protein